jgi:hypothetical protein
MTCQHLTICVSLYLNDRNIGEFFVNVGHDGPLMPGLMAHVNNAMTHLVLDIQTSNCSFLDLDHLVIQVKYC